MREIPPFEIRAFKYWRIFSSSANFRPLFYRRAQLLSQPRMMPCWLPIGLHFCPIRMNYMFCFLSWIIVCRSISRCYFNGDMIGAFCGCGKALPCGAGWNRRMVLPPSTNIFTNGFESAASISNFCSQFLMALLNTFSTGAAVGILQHVKCLIDIQSADQVHHIYRLLCALSLRCCWFSVVDPVCYCFHTMILLTVTCVWFKVSGRWKFSEFMAYHIFRSHIQEWICSIMNCEHMTHHAGQNCWNDDRFSSRPFVTCHSSFSTLPARLWST